MNLVRRHAVRLSLVIVVVLQIAKMLGNRMVGVRT